MALAQIVEADFATVPLEETEFEEFTSEAQVREAIPKLEERMREAAKQFEFERAAQLRDRVRALKQKDIGGFFQPATLPREPLPAELLAPRGTGSTSGKVGRSIRAKARKQRTRKSKHKSRR